MRLPIVGVVATLVFSLTSTLCRASEPIQRPTHTQKSSPINRKIRPVDPAKSKESATRFHGWTLQSSVWPKFHGDSQNTGLSSFGGSNGNFRWSYYLNVFGAQANPAIAADGTIYTIGGSDFFDNGVKALMPGPSGATELWSFSTGFDMVNSGPAIDSAGNVYFGCDNGNLYSVSPSGNLNWTYTTGSGIESSPSVAPDGTVYIASTDGYMYALSPGDSSATLKWQFSTGGFTASSQYCNGSPALGADGTIYFGAEDGYVYALNPSDGSVKWQFATGGPVRSSPTVDQDGTIYIGSTDKTFYALDPNTGTPKWSFLTGDSIYSTAAIGPDGTIYVGSNDFNIYALTPGSSSCTVKWSKSFIGFVSCALAVGSDGTVYMMTNCYSVPGNDSNLYALNPTDGSTLWTYGLENTNISSPAIGADGTVYAMSGAYLNAIGTQVNTVPANNLSFSPSTVVGGANSTGTVTLSSSAPAGGDVVTLISGDPSVIVPPFVTVASGNTSVNFSVTTTSVSSNTSVLITATSGNSNATATILVQADQPLKLTGLSLNPSTMTGGITTSTGTVTLSKSAPTGGTVVNLGNQWPSYVDVPTTVVVPAGASSADFSISSPQMWQVAFTDNITATLGADSFSQTLTVATYALQSVAVSPSGIGSGATATGLVTIGSPAPAGGWVVNLVSSSPYYVSVPATVTVGAGATTASFSITTRSNTPAGSYTISAHDTVIYRSGSLSVSVCPVSSVSVNPTTIAAGATATGTVTLSSPAPSGGWVVNLTSALPSELTVPATVTVPSGASSATFNVTTRAMSRTLTIGIYALDASNSYHSTSLTVVGNLITGLSLSPSTIGGNGSTTATITLASPAAAGGWNVNLSAGVPSAVGMPATVVVPAGASTVSFTINGRQSNRNYTLGIYASDGNSAQSATLTVTGNSIVSVSMSPSTVQSGNSSTGTVVLTSPAPTGGWLVTLKAGAAGSVNPPANVTVPAGATSATFTVSTVRGIPTLTSVIYASDGGSTQSTYLTVNH